MHLNSRGVTLREVELAGLPLMEEFAWASRNAAFAVQLLFGMLEFGHELSQFFIRWLWGFHRCFSIQRSSISRTLLVSVEGV